VPDLRPSPAHLALKVLTRVRARGPREVAALGFVRFKEALSSERVLIFFARDAAGEMWENEDLELIEATAADADRYARWIGTDSPTTFRARLSERTRCYLVVWDGRVVHATWMTIAAAWTREVRRYFRLLPGEAYVYESFTRPEVRGMGVYPWALTHIAVRLAGAGIRRVWIGVEADNPPSLRAVSKAGFQPVCEVAYRRRLGRLTVEDPVGEGGEECRDRLALTVEG
jgi:ribosomal protein S18 acetylase RimI-like enzyme